MQTFLLLTVAVLCALYAAYELAPEGWSAFVGALHGRAKAPASPVRDAPASQQGGIVDKPDARVPWPEHTPPARRLPRPVRRNVLLVTFGAIILLFAIDALFAAHTPVHLRLVSAGTHATLTVDGAAHSFTWPTPPTRVALLQNDPNSREWGIDGSQSLTASIANLDPAYLRSIAGAPYIAFDRWLRGEDGYDQWRNLHLNSLTNGTVTLPDTAQAVAGIPVGQSFTFDGDIYRLEQPVSVQLAFPTGAYTIRLDRANRALTIVDTPTTAGATTTIAQWYVPTDPWPYLAVNARTLAYAVAWAVLLLLLAVILGAALAAYSGERVSALWARGYSASSIVSLAALAIFLASALYVALGEYNGMPHIFDAQAYVFQAKVLASGRLFMPLPPLADSFPIPFFGVVNGHWVAQYGPGTALTLVPGILLGLPWLVQPLFAVGTLALVGAIGHRLYGRWVATVAIVLGALSPFFLFQVGAYFSHVQAAFFVTLAYYLLVRGQWGRRLWPTFGASVALGMAFMCREVSALLITIPLTVCLFGHLWNRHWTGQRSRAIAPILTWSGGGVLFGILYLLYDWSVTGDPLLSPRGVLNQSDRYGFGAGHGWWGLHTLAAALTNTDQLITGLTLDLFGWPYYMALAVPLLPFVLGRANRWDALNGAITASVIIGMMGYFYNGIAIGPRYYYEAIPALLLLTARGIQALGNAAGDILTLMRARRPRASGLLAAGVILVALTTPDVLFYLPRHVALYRNFTAMAWMPNLQLSRIYADAPPHAIIVTGDSYIFSNVTAALNNPSTLMNPSATRDTVWALASTPQRYAELRATFPRRRLFILQVTNGTTVSYQPYGAG